MERSAGNYCLGLIGIETLSPGGWRSLAVTDREQKCERNDSKFSGEEECRMKARLPLPPAPVSRSAELVSGRLALYGLLLSSGPLTASASQAVREGLVKRTY